LELKWSYIVDYVLATVEVALDEIEVLGMAVAGRDRYYNRQLTGYDEQVCQLTWEGKRTANVNGPSGLGYSSGWPCYHAIDVLAFLSYQNLLQLNLGEYRVR